MKYPDRQLTTIAELIQALKDFKTDESPTWFRGQADKDWPLVPSIARNPDNLAAELTMIKVFKQHARRHLTSLPTTEWEWVFLMQHHRAPTRLLDWTEAVLVGLFFAVGEVKHDAKDAALWFLDPIQLNRHSGHRRTFERDILAFDVDAPLKQYEPDQVNSRTVDLHPIAAIGPQNSPRMAAQAGTFTIMHAKATAVEDVADQSHIWRMVVPATNKVELRRELVLLGITESTLFPDLDRVAAVTRRFLK